MKSVQTNVLFFISLLSFISEVSVTIFSSPSLFNLPEPTDQNDDLYGISIAFGPEPDTCSEKLENLKENLVKKADFIALDLKRYSYNIQSICFLCDFEQVGVSVCNKKSSTVPESFSEVSSIIKLFDFVSDSIMRTDGVEVEYDEKYYFPTKIFIDFLALGLDDGLTYEFTNFEVLSKKNCTI
eukprot:TRINITY_DN5093_c0_g1_i5.p2 TRINITY_DN5093_c0_g1~~TRINITY_DN5093_c0_g1_i5.p2  ORF type:complete len:209 (-),score=22.58 TRINITY_DN5093_c0_g1_i5:727-1275(-)